MKTNKKHGAPEDKAEKAQSGKAAGAKPAGVTDKLFHKLQLHFTFIVTVLWSVLMPICFGASIFANLFSMEMTISAALDEAMSMPIELVIGGGVYEGPAECTVAVIGSDWDEALIIAKYDYLTEQDVRSMIASSQDGSTDIKVSDRIYRAGRRVITRSDGRSVEIYAFYDYTYPRHMFFTQSMAIGFAFLGLVILLMLFAYMLSGRILSPAHEALVKQKDLVANASHELKTPITIIGANLDVIKADGSATVDDNAKWLDNIEKQTKRMHTMVTEMLEMSSFEAAGYKPDITEFDLGELVEGYCLSFEAACYERGITLELACEENMKVRSDAKSWSKLLGILLDNAVKYADDGSRINVSLSWAGGKKRRSAALAVSNTGKTIPPEEIGFIFERFHKVGDGADSFGLGLAMAKTICENLGGDISCRSENGLTTFTVIMPVQDAAAQKPQKEIRK